MSYKCLCNWHWCLFAYTDKPSCTTPTHNYGYTQVPTDRAEHSMITIPGTTGAHFQFHHHGQIVIQFAVLFCIMSHFHCC